MSSSPHVRTPSRAGHFVVLLALGIVFAVMCLPANALAAYHQTYVFESKWDFPTPYPSPSFAAHGMALGADGDLWVASHDDYVASYTTTGTLVGTRGAALTNVFGSEGFEQIDNVALFGNSVWAVDTNLGVAKITTGGVDTGVHITSAGAGGALNLPDGVAVDASGSVYVGDRGSANGYGFRVSKFMSGGTFVTTFGDVSPTGPSTLQSSAGIAVAPDFTVYVADWQAGKVRRYTPNASRTSYTLTASWSSSLYPTPYSVAVDSAGNVFVLDTSYNTVTKLDVAGNVLAHWGGSGSGNGVFSAAWSVVSAPDGSIYVDDRDGASVKHFVPIDLGPSTAAQADLSVKKGKKVTFKFSATDDWSSTCSVTIKVYKGSKFKATVVCGSVSQGAWHTESWTCKLAKATYKWKVYATDTTGHAQTNIASKALKVK